MIHHRVGPFTTQRDIFEKVTVAAVILDDPETTFREIDLGVFMTDTELGLYR